MIAPPRVALWLLTRRLQPEDRDEVIGDLNEQFARHASTHGAAWAKRWYWQQTCPLLWRLAPNAAYLPTTRGSLMSPHALRYALRRLARQPGATLVSVLTLGCAIGASVAAWSVLSAILLHPLPVTAPNRLMLVGERAERDGASAGLRTRHVYTAYPAIREGGVFEQVAAVGALLPPPIVTVGESSAHRAVHFVSHGFFDTLGVRLRAGRGFTPEDDRPGATLVAVLSDRFWRRGLDADTRVLGREITIAGQRAAVVGVAPARFRGISLAEAPDLYLPLHTVIDVGDKHTNFFAEPLSSGQDSPLAWISLVARLRPGMDEAQTMARLASMQETPWTRGRRLELASINTTAIPEAARPGMSQFATLLAATVALLLLIGCLTVGMLLLIRTEARRDEFAMCLALGATRTTLAAGVALEGALLALTGAMLAMPMSWLMIASVGAFQLPGGIGIDLLEVGLDARALGAAMAASVVASLVIAIVAGLFGFSADVAAALRARAGATPRIRRRTRRALVIGQIAVALVLLAGAGLFLRSLAAALSLNPGFETGRIATTTIALAPYGYTPDRANRFFDDLHARLIRNPAIQSVSFGTQYGGMTPRGQVFINGEPRKFPSTVVYIAADEHYFRTIGLPLLQGRDFTPADRGGAPHVGIVSASFGRLLAHGGDPLGYQVKLASERAPTEVVGVVPDVITSVSVLEPLRLYRPQSQISNLGLATFRGVVVRATRDGADAIQDTLRTIHEIDSAIVPPAMTSMDEQMASQMRPQQFGATVLGALGVIAVILTLFGAYVLAESTAALRAREMGIRAALGAGAGQLGALMVADTAKLIGLGLAVGLVLVWLGADLIRALLFRVEPLDPTTLGAVAGLILVLGLVVSARPALRAARVDLARVLREG